MELTFNFGQIISLLPFVGAASLIFMNRKWVWESRRAIATIVSTASIVVGSVTAVVNYSEDSAVRAKEARIALEKSEQARIAALPEEDRSIELRRNAIEAEKRKTTKERYLPGVWGELHDVLGECDFYEAKLQSIEAFSRRYALGDVSPLPGPGFNMILERVKAGTDSQSWKYIYRVRDALKLYITPFPDPEIKLASQGAGDVDLKILDKG